MKLSKIVIALAMVLGAQYACAMKVPMDIQVRANTALARLGRMTFVTEAERTDGLRMIRVLDDFGKKYPQYAQKAKEWNLIMADVKSGNAIIDKKTGKVMPIGRVEPIDKEKEFVEPKRTEQGEMVVIPQQIKEKSPEEMEAEKRLIFLNETIERLNDFVAKRASIGNLSSNEYGEAREMLKRLSSKNSQKKFFPTNRTANDYQKIHDYYNEALFGEVSKTLKPRIQNPIVFSKEEFALIKEELERYKKKQEESGQIKDQPVLMIEKKPVVEPVEKPIEVSKFLLNIINDEYNWYTLGLITHLTYQASAEVTNFINTKTKKEEAINFLRKRSGEEKFKALLNIIEVMPVKSESVSEFLLNIINDDSKWYRRDSGVIDLRLTPFAEVEKFINTENKKEAIIFLNKRSGEEKSKKLLNIIIDELKY